MMARYIRSLWIWTVSGVLFLIGVPAMAVIRLFDRDPLVLRTGRSLRLLGRLLIRVHLQKLNLTGFENIVRGRTYLLVANHQSLIDIPLVSYIPLDIKCMARADLFRIPWVGWTLRMSKEISIDRKDPRNAARAMRQCVKVLRGGCSILIYPEGTRSPDGNLLPFSEGPFQLAIREGIPVLPVVLDGTGRNLGKNDLLFQRSHPMSLRILQPVSVEGWSAKQAGELRDLVRDMMAADLRRLSAAPG
ncbi:MAG: lysophospholipid acyltransferase family protein [Acidobacteriota bacterium]